MNHVVSIRSIVIALAFAFPSVDALLEQAHADEPGEPLSLAVYIDEPMQEGAIDVFDSLRVVLTNSSDRPVTNWNPRMREGWYQLTFDLANQRTGESYHVRRKQYDDERFWEWCEKDMDPRLATIEIAPGGEHSFTTELAEARMERWVWEGLPDPNSEDLFEVTARFESAPAPPDAPRVVWTGSVQTRIGAMQLVASRLKTPHDYLENNFPAPALAMMKEDPQWIRRQDDSLRTPLHWAVEFGQAEVVRWLLGNGADVNTRAVNGLTALHLAEDPDIVALLLAQKPDLTIGYYNRDNTAPESAIERLDRAENDEDRRRWEKIVRLYLGAGVEYDLRTAIYLDDLDRVKAVLKDSPELADNFRRESPLRTAASQGRLEICRYLIEQYHVDVNDFERGGGWPIIQYAVQYPDVVRLLIDSGADLKTRITWRGGRTGIWIIGDDATALHYAAERGTPETIRLLIDNGIDMFATARDSFDPSDKQTALEVAAFFGKAENARAILSHPRFDEAKERKRKRELNRCLCVGAFPTWLAWEPDRPALVEVLLEKGANPNATDDGLTAMMIAASEIYPASRRQNQEIRGVVAALVKHHAKVDLYSAVAVGNEALVANVLKQNPRSVNARRDDGYPALHIAVAMDYKNIVRQLIDAGCDLDIRYSDEESGTSRESALHCAIFWDRNEMARLLIESGADVNVQDGYKNTPLHDAAAMGNVEVVRMLLDHGANIDVIDENGKTPLDYADDEPEIKAIFDEYRHKRRELPETPSDSPTQGGSP